MPLPTLQESTRHQYPVQATTSIQASLKPVQLLQAPTNTNRKHSMQQSVIRRSLFAQAIVPSLAPAMLLKDEPRLFDAGRLLPAAECKFAFAARFRFTGTVLLGRTLFLYSSLLRQTSSMTSTHLSMMPILMRCDMAAQRLLIHCLSSSTSASQPAMKRG
ncbi:hypothetical protein KCU62_g160, partial [Aureobasidium sp. EXF-3399]